MNRGLLHKMYTAARGRYTRHSVIGAWWGGGNSRLFVGFYTLFEFANPNQHKCSIVRQQRCHYVTGKDGWGENKEKKESGGRGRLKHASELITGGNELMVVTRNHVESSDTSTLLSVTNNTMVVGGIIDVFGFDSVSSVLQHIDHRVDIIRRNRIAIAAPFFLFECVTAVRGLP